MIYTSVGQKFQTTIPQGIRQFLELHQGDRIGFEIIDNQVIIKKILPLDLEFAKAMEQNLNEWMTEEDNDAYVDL